VKLRGPLTQLLGIVAPLTALHSQASVRGHVRSTVGAPLAGATVLVVGQRIGAIADSGGAYRISGIVAGQVTVRARFFGYADRDRTLTLADGDSAVADFELPDSINTLDVVRSEAKAAEREVFDERPNLGVTLLSGKVVSTVPRLGEVDLLRVAQMLPGVMARNDFTAGLNVRGGEADQNLVLLDGYPIFNPFHMGGLFGTFMDGAVQGLELRTGGFPAQFGGRLSSVLDVQSTTETRSGLHGTANLSMLSTSATLASSFGNGSGSWMVGARRTYADKVLHWLGKDAAPYFFRDLQAHGSYRLSPRTTISATLYSGRDDLESNLAAVEDSAGAGTFGFWWGNRVLGATVQHQFTDSVSFTQRLSYSGFHTALDVGEGSLALTNDIRELRASGLLERRHGAHRPSLGYEIIGDRMLYEALEAASPILHRVQDPLTFGTFVNDVWTPSRHIMVEGGLRYERISNGSWNSLSPRLSAKYFVTKDVALTAAYGRYAQWLHSLSREDIPVRLFDFWTASDSITPVSVASHYIAGAEAWLTQHRFARIEGFVKNYDRLVEPNPFDDPEDVNDDYLQVHGRSYGAELLLRQLESGRWGGWLAYTYTFSTRTGATGTYYPGQDRRNNLNVLLSYRASNRVVLSSRFLYASGTPYTEIAGQFLRWEYDINGREWESRVSQSDVEPIGGERNAARLPPTQRLDFTLTREFDKGVTITPFLSLINAYNARNVFMYTFDYGASPPKRTAYSQLPLLPTLGLTVTW
jgi:hypothetical protein